MTDLQWLIALIMAAVLANMLLGAAVMSSVDTEDQRLFKWVHHTHEPYPSLGAAAVHMFILWPLIMNLWPVVVWAFLRKRND